MNKFAFLCLIGFAFVQFTSARVARDVSLGYNYNSGHSSGGIGFLQPPGSVTSSSSYSPTASGNSYFNAAPSFGTAGTSGFGNSGSDYNGGSGGLSFTSGGGGISSSQSIYDEQAQYAHIQHQAPIITKHFYIHSAPEDHDEQQIVRYINVGRPQQNYRVVFINAPTSSISKAKIIANVAPVEDKTAIYVLAKKSNALDVSAEVVTQRPVHHKPEVFFVKYKTRAEAEHAQHVIQSQYDILGGSSQVSNEGIIPVSSVIGSLGGSDGSSNVGSTGIESGSVGEVNEGIGSTVNIVSTGENTQQTYLPANHK